MNSSNALPPSMVVGPFPCDPLEPAAAGSHCDGHATVATPPSTMEVGQEARATPQAVPMMTALAPAAGTPAAHSTLTRLLQQSPAQPSTTPTLMAESDPSSQSVSGAHVDELMHKVGHDAANHPAIARTSSVLRRRVSASCGGTAARRTPHGTVVPPGCHAPDGNGTADHALHDGDDDVTIASTALSMPVPLPSSASTCPDRLRPPTPDHFIAVTPPSPPQSRPHRPSPPMLSPATTDDSIVAHALLARAGSLPHAHSTTHIASWPAPSMTPSPPPSSSLTDNHHADLSHHTATHTHSRVSCWSSGTAPFLSRSGTSVPSAELSSKDHMALAGWSWETNNPTDEHPVHETTSVGVANAYPPPPARDAHQVRLPLTLDDLASGRPVGRTQGDTPAEHQGSLRRHESAPHAAAGSSTGRPFSVWGVR